MTTSTGVRGGARGEGTLEAEGQTYTILYTNRALADAERALGKSIMQLLDGVTKNNLAMTDVAQLLLVGLEAARRDARTGGRSYTMGDAWRIIDALGFANAAGVVFQAMAAVIAYTPDEAEEGEESPPLGPPSTGG